LTKTVLKSVAGATAVTSTGEFADSLTSNNNHRKDIKWLI